MRLFVGIPLAANVAEELSAVSTRLRSAGDGLRWSAPDSWHVTLQFLGKAGEEEYICIVARLRELRLPPFPMRLEEMGFFDRAGIFFVGVRLTPELLSLQQRVIAATALCGFVAESRPYHPHITLARCKGRGSRQSFQQLQTKIRRTPTLARFVAEEFLLYESLPGPAGSHYEVRERFALNRGSAYGP